MTKASEKTALFETAAVPKALFTMAVPTIVSQLITLIYNMADTWFIGRTNNPYMVAASPLVLTVFLMAGALATLFGVGGGSLMVRLLGSREEAEAGRVASWTLVMAALASLVFSLLCLLFMTIPRIFYYICRISFSQVKLDVLSRIIRKTYAAEILFGMLLLITAFSIVLPNFELNIATFGDALWYCFAIVTTIGFGDITAVTIPGRIISVILGLYGLIVVALITSIIVNFYSETKNAGDENPADSM
jgi:uncharacterized membrane protein YfcA